MSKTPKLRFPEFSGEWEEKKISETLKIKHGKDQKQIEVEKGKYPILGTGGKIGETNTAIYNNESVLIGRKGTINKPMYMDTPFWTVDTLFYSEIKSDNIAKFLFYKFQCINWKKYSEASGVPSLSASTIESIKYNIPEKQEQQKIASFLSLVDKKIEKQSEKVEAIKEYKKGMMQKIFSREIRFKDDEGKEFPEWEEKKLSNITVCLDNKRKPLNSSERDKRKGTIPYYGANGIVDYIDDFIFNEELILLAEDGGNFDDYSTRPIAQLIKGKSWVNNHTHVLHCKINTTYVFYTLVHKDIRKYINGTSRAKLNKADMLEIVVQVPNIQEQQKIANFLSIIDKKLEKEEEKLETLKEWKKGLLQQMFV
ncbi:restriction endonuclease subunit S [Clostridium bornimense]|uniref:restriction endonuclease subunit S n=1 Tax=Clostridium bornimense TaxID=1216932 RepID=UPI001C11AF2D|nr:restriction endonuclease subunit S [Clostridium bornimense]MBU5316909.1 restriction endonuclease subunit S [Clostridium bornimense]